MPFAVFGLPTFAPRRWDLLALGAVIVVALAVHGVLVVDPSSNLRILGVVPGVLVGATMGTRAAGPIPAWLGLVGGVLVPGLWPGLDWDLSSSATGALFAALGMGAIAWRRVRLELTYARRIDLLCGLATVVLVLLALGLSWAAERLIWPNAAAFAWGGALLAFAPRAWTPVTPRTGSPGPGSPLDRTGP